MSILRLAAHPAGSGRSGVRFSRGAAAGVGVGTGAAASVASSVGAVVGSVAADAVGTSVGVAAPPVVAAGNSEQEVRSIATNSGTIVFDIILMPVTYSFLYSI